MDGKVPRHPPGELVAMERTGVAPCVWPLYHYARRRRCQSTGIPYGAPDDWTDLPMVEGQAAYLDRLDLWIAGERARVRPEAFDPQPFSWKITRSPHDDDDDDDDDDDQGENDDDTGAL